MSSVGESERNLAEENGPGSAAWRWTTADSDTVHTRNRTTTRARLHYTASGYHTLSERWLRPRHATTTNRCCRDANMYSPSLYLLNNRTSLDALVTVTVTVTVATVTDTSHVLQVPSPGGSDTRHYSARPRPTHTHDLSRRSPPRAKPRSHTHTHEPLSLPNAPPTSVPHPTSSSCNVYFAP